MLGLVSIFYALAIALIPFIAKRIISGDVGSTAFALVRAGGVAAGAALAGVSGFAAGASPCFRGRYSVGWRGRFVHIDCPGIVHSAPYSLDARFHSLGSCERDEQQQQPRQCLHQCNNEGSGKRDLAAAMSGSSGRHGSSYRPHSVTQVVSFNVGRALGRAAGRNNAENN